MNSSLSSSPRKLPASTMASQDPKADPLSIQRGNYNRSLPGPLLLGLGRIVSIPLQYWILTAHPLSRFGIPRPPTDGILDLPFAGPQPQLSTIFLGMTATLILKQNAWIWGYCNERITMPFAFFGVLVPAIYEALCALVFTSAASNPLWRKEFLYVGAAVHFLAAATELVSELGRASFKRDPKNKGKLYKGGLFGVVRHPNYAANVVYGAMYGFAAGGTAFALFSKCILVFGGGERG
jgi:protein-S-isoprenylcysteine O-methyltransferase Ste14